MWIYKVQSPLEAQWARTAAPEHQVNPQFTVVLFYFWSQIGLKLQSATDIDYLGKLLLFFFHFIFLTWLYLYVIYMLDKFRKHDSSWNLVPVRNTCNKICLILLTQKETKLQFLISRVSIFKFACAVCMLRLVFAVSRCCPSQAEGTNRGPLSLCSSAGVTRNSADWRGRCLILHSDTLLCTIVCEGITSTALSLGPADRTESRLGHRGSRHQS